MTPWRRLPAHALNGMAVALGIGVIQLGVGALAGPHAAQLALSGAVCASLADSPNTPPRTAQRVGAAALLGFLAALAVALLRTQPLAMGVGIALTGFVAMMAMAWGARAGAVAFAPILSMVFAMALPPASAPPLATLLAWNAVGGLAYLGWSLLVGRLLQARYRALAVADALRAEAALLCSRADLLDAPAAAGDAPPMQAWVRGEAALAESLQSARDIAFAAPPTAGGQRDTMIVLQAIELRDVLLASRLDLDLLGSDAAGRRVLAQVAQALRRIGLGLDRAADAVCGLGPAPPADATDLGAPFSALAEGGDVTRGRLLPALVDRLRWLAGNVALIGALLRGETVPAPLNAAQLQRFVAAEGWPLAALWAQGDWQSPVLRHAIRTALALGGAYAIALALPWASHPHWLVLSVAVVLRGSLEQTLARRNARVLGTLLGCAVVVGLARVSSPVALDAVFLLAVGMAHAYVMRRYWLTAGAATVMALLQAHLADPAGGFAVPERVADTLLGAALAWAFSYVLPSWERRSLPAAVTRVLVSVDDYASHALTLTAVDAVEQRLARRRAYDALSALAGALQRSRAEPRAVQPPLAAGAVLLDHAQRLMAHLSMVRLTLAQRRGELAGPVLAGALAEARAALADCLDPAGGAPSEAAPAPVDAMALLPAEAPDADALPWLLRRLTLLVDDARRIRTATQAVLGDSGSSGRSRRFTA